MKNKIEQFASVERDFPGLLIQAQQYLLFRVDLSDPSPETPTKGQRGPPLSLPVSGSCSPSFPTWGPGCCTSSWMLKASQKKKKISEKISVFTLSVLKPKGRSAPPIRSLVPLWRL